MYCAKLYIYGVKEMILKKIIANYFFVYTRINMGGWGRVFRRG